VCEVYCCLHSDGGALVYTSIRNNCNLALLYEYIIHTAYDFPFKLRSEPLNEEAIFIPLGYDKPALIKYPSPSSSDSVVKIDISRPYNEAIPFPPVKRAAKEEIVVEEDSKFFEKYINQSQSTATASSVPSEK
jgi:dynein light intermediate chain 1, cytosolic